MINAVEHLHQRIAVRPWLHVIEQIQLRDAVRTEIIEHYPRFCVAVAIEPDSVQRPDRCRDNVPGVTGRGVQFFRGHVTVIRLINRKRGCLDEGADMPAVLSLTAQLFRRALGILADGLAHFSVGGDPLPEAATADNLLFRRRRFLQRNATLAVQLTYRALQHYVEVFPDKCRVRQRQLQGSGDPHNVQLFRYPVPHAPDFFHRLQAE